jgi:hypothetical protein
VRADPGGQTAAEYLGLLAAAALLLAALWSLTAAVRFDAAVCPALLCATPAAPASRAGPLAAHLAELEAERDALLASDPWLAGDLPGLGDDLRRGLDGIAAAFDIAAPAGGALAVVDQLFGWPELRVSRRGRLADLDGRIARLRRWSGERRRLAAFDPAGDGRVVEVLGDVPPSEADHVAVFVPGVSTDLRTFDRLLRPRALALHELAALAAGQETVATVVWLGYDPPDAVVSWGGATGASAAAGGAALARFVAELDAAARPRQHQTLIGHSYGSLVAADALAAGADVDEAVLLGSPGVRRDHVGELRTRARVWAGKTVRDEIDLVPNVRVGPLGHGRDPTDPAFGARRLDTGGATGHGGYFTDLDALGAIAAVVVGAEP